MMAAPAPAAAAINHLQDRHPRTWPGNEYRHTADVSKHKHSKQWDMSRLVHHLGPTNGMKLCSIYMLLVSSITVEDL
jgi:hypothetical protein